MSFDLDRCQRLSDPAAGPLIDAAAAIDPTDVAAVARWRKRYAADELAAAFELIDARRRGAAKFGELARQMILDRVGVEQASGLAVARVKADRIETLMGGHGGVWDLCCGVGGDAMALAAAGLDVTAVDRDPMRTWQASHHAALLTGRAIRTEVADVAAFDPPAGAAVHLDPDRRVGGRRRFDPGDYEPGLAVIERLAARSTPTAVKLAPGVDPEALPAGETQWISHAGRLVQAVWWTGPVEPGVRRATLVDAGDPAREAPTAHELTGMAGLAPVADGLGRWVFEADAAAERAGLLHALGEPLGLGEAHPGLGLLTGGADIDSPWLTGFEVLARLPWRRDKVKAEVARLGGGIVEVKTRAQACDPDVEQKRLRGRGDAPLCVFVLRLGRKVEAWVTRRG